MPAYFLAACGNPPTGPLQGNSAKPAPQCCEGGEEASASLVRLGENGDEEWARSTVEGSAIMRIMVVTSDFPKVTETFVIANIAHFMTMNHTVDVFHLKPYRQGEVVHPEALPVLQRALSIGYAGPDALRGMIWGLGRPARFAALLGAMLIELAGEPRSLAASLAILPKSLAAARFCERHGVAHVHAEFAGFPATAAWIIARMTGVPFSFSAHAHDIFITQALLARKARDARFVRAISAFNKRFLEALPGYPGDRTEVLHCGVRLPENPAPPDLGMPLKLLFVGALLPRKGVGILLEALGRLSPERDWQLDVVGGGRLEPDLRALAEARLPGRVRFHGPQPSDRVAAAMRAADAVIVPSVTGERRRSEGIPVVLMEAMAALRPVIASRLSGIPELVEDGVTGQLVEPGDRAGLARAVERLLDDREAVLAMAEAGRARVAAEFDIAHTAAALLERIEGAVG